VPRRDAARGAADGGPECDADVAHRRTNHPDEPFMAYGKFFRDRQKRRHGGKDGREGRSR